VLGDIGRLDTPEGVTVLAAAVIDDVLGILVLALVIGTARGGAASPGELALITAQALGAWIGLTALFLLLASTIGRIARALRVEGAGLATVGKVVGCGVPALLTGFNRLGAIRVGIGMLPRGEVALVVAAAGLSAGVIGQSVFGVTVFVAVATTLMAPPLLVPAFRAGGSGLRRTEARPASRPRSALEWRLDPALARLLADELDRRLTADGFARVLRAEGRGEHVADYGRRELLLSVERRDGSDGTAQLRVESNDDAGLDVADEAVNAASQAARQQLAELFPST
jgi:Kef-type K+ transport system membrane component KefB